MDTLTDDDLNHVVVSLRIYLGTAVGSAHGRGGAGASCGIT